MRVPYLRSARAEQSSLGREVEIRVLRGGTPDDLVQLFFDELDELASFDHPSFLTVLNDMTLEGRPGYTVPMRDHPDLGALVGDEQFTLEDRCQAVRSMASAMAVLHGSDLPMGPLPPGHFCWDASTRVVYLRHHKVVPEHWESRLLQHTPLADADAAARPDPRDDVFYLGLLAFWLLSKGQHAYGAGPEDLRPLRGLVPELATSFASVIEAACAWDPGLRPGNAPELCGVLQLEAANVASGQEAAGDTVDIKAVSSRVLEKVQDMRSSGRIVAMRRPARRGVDDGADAMLRSDDSLIGVPANLVRLRAEARRRGLQGDDGMVERPRWRRYAAVGILLLAVGGGLYSSRDSLGGGGGGGAPPPPPPGPASPAPVVPTRPPVSGAAVDPRGKDPRLVSLLSHQGEILEEDFAGLWTSVKELMEEEKLPTGNDRRRLMRLFLVFKKRPKEAGAKLRSWIEEIRKKAG